MCCVPRGSRLGVEYRRVTNGERRQANVIGRKATGAGVAPTVYYILVELIVL